MYCVYRHIFPNSKSYIGLTKKSPEKRWGIDGYNYRTQFVYKAILKYGWDNIQHIVIKDNLTEEEACLLEQELISEYNTTDPQFGYNCTTGGESGYTCSTETRRKLSESHKGQKQSERAKIALKIAHTGVPRNDITKNKISVGRKKFLVANPLIGSNNPFYGKHHSEESKRKIREAKIGRKSGARKKVIVENLETSEMTSFDAQTEVANFLNVSPACVTKHIGNKKPIRGYILRRD